MPTRSAKITQADMQALADLANVSGGLIDIVNASIGASTWPGHVYDRYTDAPTNLILANPQPDYDFSGSSANWLSELNRIREDFFTLVFNGGDPDLYLNPATVLSGPWVVGVNDPNLFSEGSGNELDSNFFSGTIGGTDVNYAADGNFIVVLPVGLTSIKWLPKTNNDLGIIIGGTTYGLDRVMQPLAVNGEASITLVGNPTTSGNVVLINPRVGMLIGNNGAISNYYKNVAFYYAESDAPDGVTITGTMDASVTPDLSDASGTRTLDVKVLSSVNGSITLSFAVEISTGTETSAPASGDLGFSASSGSGELTFRSFSGGVATYDAVVSIDLSAASELDLTVSFTAPTGWTLSGGAPTMAAHMIFSTSTESEMINGIHPSSACKRLNCTTSPPNMVPRLEIIATSADFSAGGNNASILWTLSDILLRGCWLANTMPVPGLNVFLDQDMPPYVGLMDMNVDSRFYDIFNRYNVAISETLPTVNDPFTVGSTVYNHIDNPPTEQPDNTVPILASSMRQQALLKNGERIIVIDVPGYGPYPFDAGPKYNLISQSEQCQAAQWLVRRDTDFVPFDFGFNQSPAVNHGTYSAPSDGSLNHYNISVPLTAASVKIRTVKSGTGVKGWKNGVLQYGEPLDTPLTIYVRRDDFASKTVYDFKKTDGEVTIRPDGGRGYLGTIQNDGFWYSICNENYQVDSITLDDGGSGFLLNDVVTLAGGVVSPEGQPASIQVTLAGGSGEILEFTIVNHGCYTTPPATPNTPISGGGGHGLGAIFNLISSRKDISFDLIVEVDYSANPQRLYFPPPGTQECFTYLIADIPSGQNPFINWETFGNKPIPQNGYCIFKIRATRLPVANSAGISVTPESGDEIKIMVGQNRLQYDGTLSFAPFVQTNPGPGAGDPGTGAGDPSTGAGGSVTPYTITIPANARDSGDVEVFWPVLSGNELAYQSGEKIILEVWANWQPIFFSSMYGIREYQNSIFGLFIMPFDATAFKACLAFANLYDTAESNYPVGNSFYSNPPSRCQFPMSVEIYDDLEACLNLI
jgi:hypothetical protein